MFVEVTCLFVFASFGTNICHASASTGLRPFYVFGPMVNSLEDVDNFMGLGVNAIEADLNFASDGTPQKFYHGWPCGCHRDCEKSAGVITYLSYLRDAVSQSGKFAGKLQLLYVDTKTGSLSSGTKYQAGINLANSLINTLWNNGTIPSENMLNVILSVSSTLDKEILSGAFDTIKRAGNSSLFLDHVGFDISGYQLLSVIADIYEELGIQQHRWQGDGTTNCLIDIYWEVPTKAAISRRTAANTTDDYVDKVYVWTVDNASTMRRFLRLKIDGMFTNQPATLLSVLQETEFSTMYQLATAQDSAWKRIV
ncbi:dermonecrotic toxin SPH [Rhipicephalus microplus]|uniref:dermonecrotic toxin SPH n=1 Tax=Rhipicephalus microplus TaxID=6941 RepID=UPI003F6B2362